MASARHYPVLSCNSTVMPLDSCHTRHISTTIHAYSVATKTHDSIHAHSTRHNTASSSSRLNILPKPEPTKRTTKTAPKSYSISTTINKRDSSLPFQPSNKTTQTHTTQCRFSAYNDSSQLPRVSTNSIQDATRRVFNQLNLTHYSAAVESESTIQFCGSKITIPIRSSSITTCSRKSNTSTFKQNQKSVVSACKSNHDQASLFKNPVPPASIPPSYSGVNHTAREIRRSRIKLAAPQPNIPISELHQQSYHISNIPTCHTQPIRSQSRPILDEIAYTNIVSAQSKHISFPISTPSHSSSIHNTNHPHNMRQTSGLICNARSISYDKPHNKSLNNNSAESIVSTQSMASHNLATNHIANSYSHSRQSLYTHHNADISRLQSNDIHTTTAIQTGLNEYNSICTNQSGIHPELKELLREPSVAFHDVQNSASGGLYRSRGYTIGLKNLGNTCFMNSILQCLFSIGKFMAYFESGQYLSHFNLQSSTKGLIAKTFGEFVKNINHADSAGRGNIASPLLLKRQIELLAPQFSGYNQHDSQEFLRFLLDGLHEDVNTGRPTKFSYTDEQYDQLTTRQKTIVSWNRYKKFNNSPICDIFSGQLQSTVTCLECQTTSTTFDTFWDISAPLISSNLHLDQDGVTLDQCLDSFFEAEKLDTYRCGKCKCDTLAIKQLGISRLPSVLVIHLKRFQVLPLTDIPSRKLHTMVTFPIHQFTMNAYTSELTSAEYDLVAVSNHSGELHGGHYTSHTRNTDTGHWHLWSDSIGSQCNDLEFTQSRDAYVLFYQCTSM
ncbi:Ubiquitin carboxyl-terminal hydrolase 2, variant 2 [Batrachochytrium dendrobatidis]